jgi:hypothetical protein
MSVPEELQLSIEEVQGQPAPAEPAAEELSENPWEGEDLAEAPEEPVEPEAVEAPADEVPEEKQEEKTVPYNALHEERMLRKEASAEAAVVREKMARMEERFAIMQERNATPPEPEPEFDDDPAAFLNQKVETQQAQLDALMAQAKGNVEAQAQQTNFNNMMGSYKAAVDTYAETTPEVTEAYNALFTGRVADYEAAGYTEQEATQFAQQDEVSIVQKAFTDGVNPGERIMALAKARGWEKAAPAKQASSEKLATIEKGQKVAKTLGGGTPDTPLSLEALADMSDEDFDKNWNLAMGAKSTSIYG